MSSVARVVRLPTDAVGIVGSSAMADVNCAHLAALAMVKGAVSFDDSHDQQSDPYHLVNASAGYRLSFSPTVTGTVASVAPSG